MNSQSKNRTFSFSKAARLRRQYEFDRVYENKCFAADDVLVIQGADGEQQHSRLGLSVSRKVGNAVIRAHWKRLIREAFRMNQHEIPQGIDFIVRPRKGAQADLRDIQRSLFGLSKQIARRLQRQRSRQ